MQRGEVLKIYETEYMRTISKFKVSDPIERAQTARQTNELKTRNKEGNSYSMLFEHGNYKDELQVSSDSLYFPLKIDIASRNLASFQ